MKRFLFACFLSMSFLYLKAQDKSLNIVTKPFVLGTTIQMQSKVLAEQRLLNIYLPDGYHESDTMKYPVIYLLDGSADEDFIHIAGLVQYLNFPWIKSVPNSIVVGIANVDRRRDFTFPTTIEKDKKDFPTTGKSEKFITFLEKELQPLIEKMYKTNSSKTIIGQSLGGLVATEILFKKPQLFTKYLIVSPSLWWDKESLLSLTPNVLKPGFTDSISVFVAGGNEGKTMEEDTKKLVSILKSSGKNISVSSEYFGNENHASILHNAAYMGLEVLNKNAGNLK